MRRQTPIVWNIIQAKEICDRILSSGWNATVATGEANQLVGLIEPLHESDLGELLGAVDPATRTSLVELAGKYFDFSALTEVDEAIRLEVVNSLSNKNVAKALNKLDSDDAVYILEDMEQSDQEGYSGSDGFC